MLTHGLGFARALLVVLTVLAASSTPPAHALITVFATHASPSLLAVLAQGQQPSKGRPRAADFGGMWKAFLSAAGLRLNASHFKNRTSGLSMPPCLEPRGCPPGALSRRPDCQSASSPRRASLIFTGDPVEIRSRACLRTSDPGRPRCSKHSPLCLSVSVSLCLCLSLSLSLRARAVCLHQSRTAQGGEEA